MMKAFHRTWRIVATALGFFMFAIGTVGLSLLLLIGLVPLPLEAAQKHRRVRFIISRLSGLYLSSLELLNLLDLRLLRLQGLNQPGHLVVANHPTLLDALILMSVMPNATFVVKAAMAKNVFTRYLVSLAGYLPNDYDGPALVEKAVALLRRGESLIIFPEGTRTPNADRLHFQRGAANIALRAPCPILPLVIRCQPTVLRKGEAWYRVPDSTPVFTLYTLPPIKSESCVNTDHSAGIQARELTRQLQNLFAAELVAEKESSFTANPRISRSGNDACIIPGTRNTVPSAGAFIDNNPHPEREDNTLTLAVISEDFSLSVPFFDVDSMNVVWHGHYCKYLELARCKLLDKIGYNYRHMAESGFAFPIVDMQIKYIKPLVFAQSLIITASLLEWQYRLKIRYHISDAVTREILTKAYTVQAAVDKQTGVLRLECPDILHQRVEAALRKTTLGDNASA